MNGCSLTSFKTLAFYQPLYPMLLMNIDAFFSEQVVSQQQTKQLDVTRNQNPLPLGHFFSGDPNGKRFVEIVANMPRPYSN